MKVNRFKIEIIDDDDIKREISGAVMAVIKLGETPYVKRVAGVLGLKDYELIRVVKDLKIKTFKGKRSEKTIL